MSYMMCGLRLLLILGLSVPAHYGSPAQGHPEPQMVVIQQNGSSDWIHCMAADTRGNVYLAGETRPQAAKEPAAAAGAGSHTDILLIKIGASGEAESRLLLGGTGDDVAYGIAIDAEGRVHLAGRTSSLDFPVKPGAAQTQKGGGWDGFYLRLAPDGKTTEAATYLGGEGDDKASAISVNHAGAAYVAGSTWSPRFPPAKGKRRGNSDAFLVKLHGSRAQLNYGILFGGAYEDYANALTLDAAGDVWIAGQTNSPDVRVTAGAAQRRKHGLWDAFAVRMSSQTGKLLYGTFLGSGPGPGARGVDNARAIAMDSEGRVWVAGETDGRDLPVTDNALETGNTGGRRGFLLRLDSGGTKVGYASYIGGNGNSTATWVAAGGGLVAVGGTTSAVEFPSHVKTMRLGPGGADDVYALVLGSHDGGYVCGARIGGSAPERSATGAILPDGSVAAGGSTSSADLAKALPGAAGPAGFFFRFRCPARTGN